MVIQIIKYYTDLQNNHVKHDDKMNDNEIEFVIELTSKVEGVYHVTNNFG